jgi:hypothetical protein
MSAVQLEAQLGITYKTAWLLAQTPTIDDPQRAAGGVVEVDRAEIPFGPTTAFSIP